MNNPLKYTDPSGETPLATAAVGAIVGGGLYALDYGVKHDFNYSGWNAQNWQGLGMAALGGAMIGLGIPVGGVGGMSAMGATVLQIGLSHISGQMPGINIPIGSNASLSISPAFVLGSGGFGMGANINFTYQDDLWGFSAGYGR